MARRYSSEGIAHNCAHLKLSDAARLVLFHSKEKELTQSWMFFSHLSCIPNKNRWLSQSRVSSYIACALERADGSFFVQARRSHHALFVCNPLLLVALIWGPPHSASELGSRRTFSFLTIFRHSANKKIFS